MQEQYVRYINNENIILKENDILLNKEYKLVSTNSIYNTIIDETETEVNYFIYRFSKPYTKQENMKTQIEIKSTEEQKEEEIFVQGNIVESKDKLSIVLIIEKPCPSSSYFKGIVIKSKNNKLGELGTDWIKSYFKQFKGEIVLKID